MTEAQLESPTVLSPVCGTDEVNSNDSLMAGLRKLKEERMVLEEQVSSMEEKQSLATGRLMIVLGIIAQFKISGVRKDFLRGQIIAGRDFDTILTSLERIGDLLLPSPNKQVSSLEATGFAAKLLSQSLEEPIIGGNSLAFRQSYASWRRLVQDLSESKYWSSEAPLGFCENEQQFKYEHNVMGNSQFGGGMPAEFPNQRHSSPTTKTTSSRRDSKLKRKVRQEPISSSNSDFSQTDSDETSDSSVESLSTSGSLTRRNKRTSRKNSYDDSVVEILRNMRFAKEVVAPPVYDASSSTSFREFLKSYEKYFSHKFHGNEKEKARQLGKFLRGTAKEAYDAIGGNNLKYRELKPSLLNWYDGEKGSSSRRRKREFETCRMAPGESVTIYCLRLERLAKKAFPDSRKEKERNLNTKVRETFPSSLVDKIDNAQGLVNAFGGARVNWRIIKKLAENFDHLRRERKSVCDGESLENNGTHVFVSGHKRDTGTNGGNRQLNGGNFRIPPINTATSKPPQSPARGYSNNGTGHKRSNFREAPVREMTNSPSSSNCWTPGDQNNSCAWCNKPGHKEMNCWMKNGACLLCGSMTHFLKDCRGNQFRRSQRDPEYQRNSFSPQRDNGIGSNTINKALN